MENHFNSTHWDLIAKILASPDNNKQNTIIGKRSIQYDLIQLFKTDNADFNQKQFEIDCEIK